MSENISNQKPATLIDIELVGIVLIVGGSLSVLVSMELIEAGTAMVLFWLLSQGRLFTRFSDLRRSKRPAWRFFFLNQFMLAILTVALGIMTK